MNLSSCLWLCCSLLVVSCSGFAPTPSRPLGIASSAPCLIVVRYHSKSPPQHAALVTSRHSTVLSSSMDRTLDEQPPSAALQYKLAGVATTLAWTIVSILTLSYHPDPKFVGCTVQHNVLTMAQALVFPLGVIWGGFGSMVAAEKRRSKEEGLLKGGLCATNLYLMFATGICPSLFAFGYDLLSTRVKVVTSLLFGFSTTVATRGLLWRDAKKKKTEKKNVLESTSKAPLVASGAIVGLLWFAIQPLVANYPLATIPTILGKRLSRAASAFTFLGAIELMVLASKEEDPAKQELVIPLRRGLGIGSALHLLLILLKLIGVDDGGLLLPGRGLWTWYPAMMAVPFATGASCLVHALVCLACF